MVFFLGSVELRAFSLTPGHANKDPVILSQRPRHSFSKTPSFFLKDPVILSQRLVARTPFLHLRICLLLIVSPLLEKYSPCIAPKRSEIIWNHGVQPARICRHRSTMTLCPSRPEHNFHRSDCKLIRCHDPFPPYSVPSPGMQIDAVTIPTCDNSSLWRIHRSWRSGERAAKKLEFFWFDNRI